MRNSLFEMNEKCMKWRRESRGQRATERESDTKFTNKYDCVMCWCVESVFGAKFLQYFLKQKHILSLWSLCYFQLFQFFLLYDSLSLSLSPAVSASLSASILISSFPTITYNKIVTYKRKNRYVLLNISVHTKHLLSHTSHSFHPYLLT